MARQSTRASTSTHSIGCSNARSLTNTGSHSTGGIFVQITQTKSSPQTRFDFFSQKFMIFQDKFSSNLKFHSKFSFEKNLKLTFISIPRTGFIQQGNAVQGQPRPPNHIITRPQMPGAPMQWMQQQVRLVLSVQCLDN